MKQDFTSAAKLPSFPAIRTVNKGVVEWRNEFNELHREDGPARELPNGNLAWYLFGKAHRAGGPAFEQPDGFRLWFRDNELHRDDGPAVECPGGHCEWWKNGKKLTAAEIGDILAAKQDAQREIERKQISEQAALTVREGVAGTISLKLPLRFKRS